MEDRWHEMVELLREKGPHYGLACRGDSVVVVGPGAPLSVVPTMFSRDDLDRAIAAGRLEEWRLAGSGGFEMRIYRLKQA